MLPPTVVHVTASTVARLWPALWVVLFVLGWSDPAPLVETPLLASAAMDVVFAAAVAGAVGLVIAPRHPAARYTAGATGMCACVTRAMVFALTPTSTGAVPVLVVATWLVLGLSWVVLTALSWWVIEHERRVAA